MNETIIEILESMDDSIDWQTEYLNEIENWADVIENLDRPVQEKVQHYFEEILPLQWKVFGTVNQYRINKNQLTLKKHYDVGIFLVGFSEIPIILSVATLQPEEIYFLYSQESKTTLKWIPIGIERIQPDLKSRVENAIKDQKFALPIPDSFEPVETFKRIKEVVQHAPDKTIAIDITGGKKTMNSGGFTAGSIWSDCDIFYIDFLDYAVHKRRPVYGTEFLSKLDTPYEIYNIQSRAEAEKLFQQHNYEAAEELLRTVSKNLGHHASRYGLGQEQQEVDNLLEMTTCYKFWDALDYKEAKKHKGTWGYQKQHTISGIIDVLDTLSEVDEKKTLFVDEKRVISFAIDRYQNALRRLKSGRFEDAIIRFAQVIEIFCNYKIYQIAASNQLEDESGQKVKDTTDIRWNLSSLIRFLFGNFDKYYDRNKTYQIKDSVIRLKEGDYTFEVGKMLNFVEARNNFAHVEKAVTQNDAENLKELSKQFLENFSKEYCSNSRQSFDKLLNILTLVDFTV